MHTLPPQGDDVLPSGVNKDGRKKRNGSQEGRTDRPYYDGDDDRDNEGRGQRTSQEKKDFDSDDDGSEHGPNGEKSERPKWHRPYDDFKDFKEFQEWRQTRELKNCSPLKDRKDSESARPRDLPSAMLMVRQSANGTQGNNKEVFIDNENLGVE